MVSRATAATATPSCAAGTAPAATTGTAAPGTAPAAAAATTRLPVHLAHDLINVAEVVLEESLGPSEGASSLRDRIVMKEHGVKPNGDLCRVERDRLGVASEVAPVSPGLRARFEAG